MKTPFLLGARKPTPCARVGFPRLALVFLALSAVARAVDPVSTPTLVPNGGTFSTFQLVTVNCATEDAVLYYKTDGSDPGPSDNLVPANRKIQIQASPTTLNVKAFLNTVSSNLRSATYHITGLGHTHLTAGLSCKYYNLYGSHLI